MFCFDSRGGGGGETGGADLLSIGASMNNNAVSVAKKYRNKLGCVQL